MSFKVDNRVPLVVRTTEKLEFPRHYLLRGFAIYLQGPFVLNLDPAFAEVLGVKLWFYGLSYAIGFLALFLWVMLRRGYLGISSRQAWDFSLLFSLTSLIAGRAFEIFFYEWELFRGNYPEMIAYWHGGLSYYGVILGALFGVLLFCIIHKKKFLLVADEIVIPVAFLLALSSLGSHLNGEVYGYATTAWWGVKFPHAQGFRHPVALYDTARCLVVIIFLIAAAKKAIPGQGRMLGHFMFWYGALGVIVDLFQDPGTVIFLQIGMDHVSNALVAIIGILLIVRSPRKNLKTSNYLNTLHFAPASLIARMPAGLDHRVWFRIGLFLLILLFCLTIPSGFSREWLYHLSAQQGI